jgi:hypothetical protein
MKLIMNFFRYIFGTALSIILLGLLFWLVDWSFQLFINLSLFWQIFVFILFASAVFTLFTGLVGILVGIIGIVIPNRNFTKYLFITLAVLSIIGVIGQKFFGSTQIVGGSVFYTILHTIASIMLSVSIIIAGYMFDKK